ncbi:MAG: hypothetical protein KGZ34_07105 [Nitrosarchaeum sp.]|nr:hypothetical protein [Nitrosarchaeum sp.]
MGNLAIEDIRKLAELNFPPECYKIYLAIIEPNIKSIIPNYLKNWQSVEGYVTMTVMRHMGIFKTMTSIISINEDVDPSIFPLLDVKKFKEVKKQTFKQKIDFLKKEGILKENSYKLLDILRLKRNKIHEMDTIFSDKDLQEFSIAKSIIFWIHAVQESSDMSKKEQNRLRNMAEKWAEEALKVVHSH